LLISGAVVMAPDRRRQPALFAVLQLDQDVLIKPAAEIAQLVLLAGIAPDHAAHLVVGDDGVAADVLKFDLAAGDVDDDVIELVVVPGFPAAGRNLHVPDPHLVILENNFSSNRPARIFPAWFVGHLA
jgi:hypothetical protein